jgi:hypothetical protein
MAIAFFKEGVRKETHAFCKGQGNPVGYRINLIMFHGIG